MTYRLSVLHLAAQLSGIDLSHPDAARLGVAPVLAGALSALDAIGCPAEGWAI